MRKIQDEVERFWRYVEKRGEAECWPWKGAIHRTGYGVFCRPRPKRQEMAHRCAYEFAVGEIPSGLYACHSCDNRSCVNPNHLWLGTHLDNMADMRKKKRAAVIVGSARVSAKLDETRVSEIRERYARGEGTQDTLAEEYGVQQATIWRIVRRKTWTHV